MPVYFTFRESALVVPLTLSLGRMEDCFFPLERSGLPFEDDRNFRFRTLEVWNRPNVSVKSSCLIYSCL